MVQNNELPPPGAGIPELSMVMPAHDEAGSLGDTLAEVAAALDATCGRWELIVVDDGSTDDTAEVLRRAAAADDRIRVLTQRRRSGFGAALRRGFDAARYMVVGTVDADGQYDVAEVALLYPFLRSAEMVGGIRARLQYPVGRRLGSRVQQAFAEHLLDLAAADLECAFRLYRRSFLLVVQLTRDDLLIKTELYLRARQAGLRWAQVMVSHRPRRQGASAVTPAVWWRSLRGLLELRSSAS